MREIAFSTFQELARLANERPVVLFGAGNIAAKTARRLSEAHSFIVDNNPNLWGTTQLGVEVRKPDVLRDCGNVKPLVVICTTSFGEVAGQLQELGFGSGTDFVVSPILNDLRVISEMESCRARMLFTSGFPEQAAPEYGGGIYELELRDDEWEYRKVYSGICYGLIPFDENYIAVDDKLGIVELAPDYRVVRNRGLEAGMRAHGIAYSDTTDCFYVAASYRDKVLIFDRDLDLRGEIPVSSKYEIEGEPCHHFNDLCAVGHSLYISMFSHTGNWKRDVFDGVILEVDLTTQEVNSPIISDLWMPHNVVFLDGSIVVLDSLRGQLRKHNAQVVGEFPGFARGLGHDGTYFYVGQSRNRNYSRYLGLSNNISIDTSIIVFDEITKVSRSLQLPSKLSEIHAILLI